MNVQQLMSQPVASCGPNDSLNAAAQMMWERDCGAVPVIDADGRLIGIVTDRDICMAAYTRGSSLASIQVSDAMATVVYRAHPGDTLEAAERLMTDKQVRRLPVVDDSDRPIGVISLADIAREAARSNKPDATDHAVVRTLSAICQPRTGRPARPGERAASQLRA